MIKISHSGLDNLASRLKSAGSKYTALIGKATELSMLVLWQQTGESYYPPKPEESKYRRTGTLGRTLGTSEGGGMAGKPEVYESRQMGDGSFQGSFGTRLGYAKYVIGSSATEQAGVHRGRWKTLPEDIVNASLDGIRRVFQKAMDQFSSWITGK